MISEFKRYFEDVDMSHKMDELLHAAGLSTDIDAISDSTGDSEAQPIPHPHTFRMKMLTSRLSTAA
jgi:hypothetical protein